jgi:hypothetical protein
VVNDQWISMNMGSGGAQRSMNTGCDGAQRSMNMGSSGVWNGSDDEWNPSEQCLVAYK